MYIYIWHYPCVHGGIFKLLGKGTFAKEGNIFEGVIFFLLAKWGINRQGSEGKRIDYDLVGPRHLTQRVKTWMSLLVCLGKCWRTMRAFLLRLYKLPKKGNKKSNESSTGKVKQQKMAIITPCILRISTFLMRQTLQAVPIHGAHGFISIWWWWCQSERLWWCWWWWRLMKDDECWMMTINDPISTCLRLFSAPRMYRNRFQQC